MRVKLISKPHHTALPAAPGGVFQKIFSLLRRGVSPCFLSLRRKLLYYNIFYSKLPKIMTHSLRLSLYETLDVKGKTDYLLLSDSQVKTLRRTKAYKKNLIVATRKANFNLSLNLKKLAL